MRTNIYWHLLLTASSIAAIVSLLTTALGLERYMVTQLAWLLSFAVQAGLFGMAWLIGASIQRLRGLVVLLYCLTMPFSVAFSYVTLQSEFTKQIKPRESQRALFDRLRQNTLEIGSEISQGINQTDDIVLRLEAWLDMESKVGWATQTCDEANHCYLAETCKRIRDRISTWEKTTNRAYTQGPGKQLIYGLLRTEVNAAKRLSQRIESFKSQLADGKIFEADIDNRERLTRYDAAISQIPRADVESVLCRELQIPNAPEYEDYARDDALSEEQPVFAFDDLLVLLDPSHRMSRADYPTVFALLLALFVDFFVLFVAIGATLIDTRDAGQRGYPISDPVPSAWISDVERDIKSWIDGSLLARADDAAARARFLEKAVKSVRLDGNGRSILVPSDKGLFRLGHLLLKSKAASQELAAAVQGKEEQTVFVLEDWVYPALCRRFGSQHRSSENEVISDEVCI